MASGIALIIVIVLFVLIGIPILAIIAFARSSRLRAFTQQVPRLTARIYDLERRLDALERKLRSPSAAEERTSESEVESAAMSSASQELPAAASPEIAPAEETAPPSPGIRPTVQPEALTAPEPAAPPQTPTPAPTERNIPPAAPHRDIDVETLIAGRWLYYLGILALLFAVAFFLKYAFENDWVGPDGRVGIGVALGAAMFPLSDWLLHRGYRYFSEGITGLGSAVLYLSIWAGWHYYTLFPQAAAFGVMAVITALTAAVAIGRNSERIAVVALAGGALTPLLINTGENQEIALFTYLTILSAAMLAIAFRRNWRTLALLQFAATLFYFWGWYTSFYARYELATTVFFATIFFALFAALPAVRGAREGEFRGEEIAVVLVNAFQYLGALRLMLWPEFPWGLTLAVLGLAALHGIAALALPRRNTQANRTARAIYAGLALTFATLAIPIRLDGRWITIAWAVEGAALIGSGLRIRSWALRAGGIVLFVIVAIRIAAVPFHPGPTFLLNERFLTMALCAACFLSAFWFAQHATIELGGTESRLYYALAIAGNTIFLAGLSFEVWDLYGRMPSLGIDSGLAQNLALSVLWLVYALALLAGGVVKKSAGLRWQALALLGVVVAKVFFFDLSFLARFYRIVSFLLLGVALMLVSFFYQRRRAARGDEKGSQTPL